jgi:3-hydroxyisobutyrate dehydrogenase-like beta-hydroxyacid dehydrogenase
MSDPLATRICFIGFGEAGQAIAAGLRETGVGAVSAWDILFADGGGDVLRQACARIGVRQAHTAADAVQDADMIVCAVTAASSLEAARSAVDHLKGQLFLDINSVSPGRKKATAKLIGAAARYVDVAVMGPIYPARHKTPMLLAGEHAEALAPQLAALGMSASVAGREIGEAAAIKMVRSVMIKGWEALTLECFVAAARAGVEEQVLQSLMKSFPTLDWGKIVEYNVERMATHGTRRAAEMEEVAETLRELGVDPLMAAATVERQRDMGRIGKQPSVRAAMDQGRSAILKSISAAAKDRH